MKSIAAGAFTLCFILRSGFAQTPQPIPSQYQDVSNSINVNLTTFGAALNSQWSGAPPASPVAYAPQLQTALSDLTTNLLQPNYYQMVVLAELNSLEALGAKAVTFHVNFPTLLPSYYTNATDYQAYLNFYTTLVAEIRSRGMKVMIENTTGAVYPGTNGAGFAPYYQTLNWTTYMSQRAQLAGNIAKLLKPDYLVVVAEPDTEANTASQPNANTIAGSTQMIQGMLTAIQTAGATNVKVAAGCGTWNPQFLQYIRSFATLPLSTIDMHIYPINKNNLPNAMAAIPIIQAAGKQASMSETWLYKESDTEYAAQTLSYTSIYARDVYSFWSATDVSFLKAMTNLANYGKFAFMAPFWTHYFAAYLDYNSYSGQTDIAVITASAKAATQANMVGSFTPTGRAWENMLIASLDRTAPQAPAAPALVGVTQTASSITWAPSSDNIGVAAYNIYRNGSLVGTVNNPLTFPNLELTPSTKYSYTLAAFDASGNLSPQSAPLVLTTLGYPDTTAPSIPAHVQATAFSDTQVNLTWTASTDNVGVTGYEIYRGTSADNITAFATSSVNSFHDLSLAPSRTYYYQIDAFDAANNHSSRTPIASMTTLADTTAPSTPAHLTALSQNGPIVNLSWSASTDNYMVGLYQVYRGTSASNLELIGGTGAALTFSDAHLVSGKTYYYAVAAVDIAKNVSPKSNQVVITAP